MSQVAEQLCEECAHRPSATDDGDGERRRLVRQLGAQRGLVVAAHAKQDAEQRLDLSLRQSHLLGALRAILEDFALALRIADAKVVLALVRGDFRHDRHAAYRELQQLMIEGIDHGAEERERTG